MAVTMPLLSCFLRLLVTHRWCEARSLHNLVALVELLDQSAPRLQLHLIRSDSLYSLALAAPTRASLL
jgi:hypothetical protein